MLHPNRPSTFAANMSALNRRQFLQWSGLMGMAGMGRFQGRSPHLTTETSLLVPTIARSRNEDLDALLQQRTLAQPSVTVNPTGTVIHASTVTVQVFEEPLGNNGTLTMVKIPAGQARLGSLQAEIGRFDHEVPCDVTVSSFFMGMMPITQSVYTAVMGDNPTIGFGHRSLLQPEKPVVGIRWEDAIAFCHALSQRTGKLYRLPTETEWEYACRAGTQSPFHYGATLTGAIANYNSEIAYGAGLKDTARRTTTLVGQFSPNAFGLFDMHGNVWEWCSQDYSSIPVLRGGAWNSYPWICRSATRLQQSAPSGLNTFGLRVACSPYPYVAT